jgi:hypothetical protein
MLFDLQKITEEYNNYIKTTIGKVKTLKYYAQGELSYYIPDRIDVIKPYLLDKTIKVDLYNSRGFDDIIIYKLSKTRVSKVKLPKHDIGKCSSQHIRHNSSILSI